MNKKPVIITVIVLFVLLCCCGSGILGYFGYQKLSDSVPDVSLERSDVEAYFNNIETPENVIFTYDDNTDGSTYLNNIYESSSMKFMSSIVNLKGRTIVKGQYNGTWLYGIGDGSHILMATGDDKDTVYNFLQGYTDNNLK